MHTHDKDDETLRFACCRSCGETFYACAKCDRFGERRYCSEGCQRRGSSRVDREARRREARSVEGRLNNSDRQRWFRQMHPGRRGGKARQAAVGAVVATGTDEQVVTDPPSGEATQRAEVSARSRALASTKEVATRLAQSMNDESMDGDIGATIGSDTVTDDGGARRADAGDSGAGAFGAPASGADAARGAGAVASAPALRCSLCGRAGIYLCIGAGGRAGAGSTQSALRGRGRTSQSRASPA